MGTHRETEREQQQREAETNAEQLHALLRSGMGLGAPSSPSAYASYPILSVGGSQDKGPWSFPSSSGIALWIQECALFLER